jgi:hypothetical protein
VVSSSPRLRPASRPPLLLHELEQSRHRASCRLGIEGAGRFNVSIGHFRGIDLAKKDEDGTTSTPFLVCNWDNFYKFKTDAVPRSTR